MTFASGKALFERARTLLQDRALLLKAVSFACIGVLNTLVDFGVFSLGYLYLGLPIVVANVASWTVAVTGSYVMNSLITFAAESKRELRAKTYVSFVGFQLGGLIANTATVVVASYFIQVLLAKALAIAVSFLVNFSLTNFIVFRSRSHPRSAR